MKLIMTKGLPGSGKSTWAKEQTSFKRVNKDDLRKMLDNGNWSGNREQFVLMIRDLTITAAFEKGYSVIVDDTNLHPKHEVNLRALAKNYNARFEIKDFTEVPIETCIKQDLMRDNSVGEAVIRKMYKQFLAPKPPRITYNSALHDAIICDLDGTLALFGDANPYERDFSQDKVNNIVKNIFNGRVYSPLSQLIIVSGRKDTFADVTEKWLKDNVILYDHLYMRKADDNRPDYIVKREIYEQYIQGKYNVLFVLDDRNQVVELWRSLGLVCLQVADGDF